MAGEDRVSRKGFPSLHSKSGHPRKRFYRARAHSNPLSDAHFPVPISPAHIDWSEHFPAFFAPAQEEIPGERNDDANVADEPKLAVDSGSVRGSSPKELLPDPNVRFADIGCGFGGLMVKLSPMFPTTLMIGMELRDKVSEYVKDRILALRRESPGQYENISIVRTNAMKYLHNYFQKEQLQKMFFLFPDPHFKERNHRRRVINVALLAEYAHVMAVGGILYTITDVQELGQWMKNCLDAHPLFEEVSAHEQEADPVVKLLKTATEEGQKVERNCGETFQSVYRRIHLNDAAA